MGCSPESPAAVFRWQTIDRYVEAMLSWDRDGDGLISAHDILGKYEGSILAAAGVPIADVMPDQLPWTAEALRTHFERRYEEMKADALGKPPEAAFPDTNPEFELVAASNAWWRQWFIDEVDLLERLQGYTGRVLFHVGEIDSHLSCRRAVARIRDVTAVGPNPSRIVVHPCRGHGLRAGEPSVGPMDVEAERIVVDSVVEAVSARPTL
jgi:hypothetical protein